MTANYDGTEDLRKRLQTIGNMTPKPVAPRIGSGYQGQQMPQGKQMRGIPKGNGDFESFMRAISAQESGNNYRAMGVNVRGDRAHGKYQIMGNNIPSWTREALGRSVSSREFLNNPQIQEAVARYKMQRYYQKYGAAGAAVAWYAGEGNAKKYVRSNGAGYNRRQNGGRFPSVNQYAQSILRRMGLG